MRLLLASALLAATLRAFVPVGYMIVPNPATNKISIVVCKAFAPPLDIGAKSHAARHGGDHSGHDKPHGAYEACPFATFSVFFGFAANAPDFAAGTSAHFAIEWVARTAFLLTARIFSRPHSRGPPLHP